MPPPAEHVEHRIEHRTIINGGVELRCATAGAPDAPMVLLLHGFPARWSTWRTTMGALAGAGYFAVAPDLRGAGESGKPLGTDAYAIDRFVDDVEAIVEGFGRERVSLAGHDFGGGIAWATAMRCPSVVERLAILNSVHPVGFQRQMKRWSQIAKSWYVFLFQLPAVPEWLLSRDDFRFLRRALVKDGLAAETADDLLLGIRADGALRAMLDWYRASFRDGVRGRFVPQKVATPTLVVWGDRETHLDPELASPPPDWTSNVVVAHLPSAGHWVQHDAPEQVAALLTAHFRPRGPS